MSSKEENSAYRDQTHQEKLHIRPQISFESQKRKETRGIYGVKLQNKETCFVSGPSQSSSNGSNSQWNSLSDSTKASLETSSNSPNPPSGFSGMNLPISASTFGAFDSKTQLPQTHGVQIEHSKQVLIGSQRTQKAPKEARNNKNSVEELMLSNAERESFAKEEFHAQNHQVQNQLRNTRGKKEKAVENPTVLELIAQIMAKIVDLHLFMVDSLDKEEFNALPKSIPRSEKDFKEMRNDPFSFFKGMSDLVAFICHTKHQNEKKTQETIDRMTKESLDYEGLLQKLEGDVRQHIRIEQQLKIDFENWEESMKELEKARKENEALRKEVILGERQRTKLNEKLARKEEEINKIKETSQKEHREEVEELKKQIKRLKQEILNQKANGENQNEPVSFHQKQPAGRSIEQIQSKPQKIRSQNGPTRENDCFKKGNRCETQNEERNSRLKQMLGASDPQRLINFDQERPRNKLLMTEEEVEGLQSLNRSSKVSVNRPEAENSLKLAKKNSVPQNQRRSDTNLYFLWKIRE